MNWVIIPIFFALTTLCTPYDDVQTAVIQMLGKAQHQVLIAGYSITNQEICNELIGLHSKGVDVEIITDKVQAAGPAEKAALANMASFGIPIFIGQSKFHALMHAKFIVIDDLLSETGSYNFTKSANFQDNVAQFSEDPELAKQLHSYWNQIKEDLK